jgi:hypothetical protein
MENNSAAEEDLNLKGLKKCIFSKNKNNLVIT